jgi:formate hydrogenlyase subunit 3/multisubunit Na+/H+ antiporter MnhD subunit
MNTLYWITRLGEFNAYFTVSTILCIILAAIFGICISIRDKSETGYATIKKYFILSLIGVFAFGLITTLIPTTDEAKIIYKTELNGK